MAAVKSLLATEGQSRAVMEKEAAFGLLFVESEKKNRIERIFFFCLFICAKTFLGSEDALVGPHFKKACS